MSSTDERDDQEGPVPGPQILGELAADLRSLIEEARLRVARTVNAQLVVLYWEIGNRIQRDILGAPARSTAIRLSLHCRDN